MQYDGAGAHPRLPHFFCVDGDSKSMTKAVSLLLRAAQGLSLALLCLVSQAQEVKPAAGSSGGAQTAEQAIALGQQGRCREALPGLRRVLLSAGPKGEKKTAGIVGARCAMTLDDRPAAGEFLGQLSKQFRNDPDVLYILVHAYSDLSARAAGDLGQRHSNSVEARKLNAEALEVQGKWEEAAGQYRQILETNPEQLGIHYLLGRVLLSKPDADAERVAAAKQEFVKELELDPKNAGAEYVLGEMARQNADWDEAIKRFSQAAKLDAGFADAFWGWGFSLVSAKRFEEAIVPLRVAVRMQPTNPSAHYNLGVALIRTGHKEEADKEFAIQKELVAKRDAERNAQVEGAKPQ